jgi:signal transduction histidine kinase
MFWGKMLFRFLFASLQTLRGRLSAWYLASIILIFFLFTSGIISLFWITLQEQIDHHLHIAVNEARQIVERFQADERDLLIKNLVSAQGMTVVVLSPDGAPILETNSPDVALVTEHQLQSILSSSKLNPSEPTHFTESGLRFAAMRATVSGGSGIVAVGYSTKILEDAFYRLLAISFTVILLLAVPLTLIGHVFIKRQLKPLEEISFQAQAITNPFQSKRIRTTNSTQEITAIQKALNNMLAQLEAVFQSERAFFSDAAHTLKTPLAVLRSQLETSRIPKKKRSELINTIDLASDTVQDLLFLAKISDQNQAREQFSLSQLMADLAELAQSLGEEKQLRVTSSIQPGVNFTADRKLLQRAMANIVHNAVVYNQKHGSIKLELRQTKDKILLSVQDSGSGISKKDLPHIYERFYRGKNQLVKGSGLGLAIAKVATESMNGKLALASSPRGTKVTVTLPL